MFIGEMSGKILRGVANSGATITDPEVRDCIDKAVRDLSRYYPRELIYDVALSFSVTDESITTGETLTTAISLAGQMIKPKSESVKSIDGSTAYTRDTDYSMDYVNGVLTPISDGSMVAETEYYISYTKLRTGFSISAIADALLNINKVEYPAGSVPSEDWSFDRWGSFMFLTSGPVDSQMELSEGQHAFVFYRAYHTSPTTKTHGTYPRFLDEVIILGAESYALLLRVMKLVNDAKTLITSAGTDLTSAKAVLEIAIETAGDAKTLIDGISTSTHITNAASALDDIADALTDAETALGKVETYKGSGYLDSGAAKIDTANKGLDVAENYRGLTEASVQIANAFNREGEARISEAIAYIQECQRRLDIASVLVDQSNLSAQRYNESGAIEVQSANLYVQSAANNIELARINLSIAEKVKAEADYRKAEFLYILGDKGQLMKQLSTSPVLQPK